VEVLQALLQGLAAAVGTVQTSYNLYHWLSQRLRKWGHEKTAREIKQLLDSLGCVAESAVRKLIADWARDHPELTAMQQEELTAILVNLTRGARFLSTQGTPRSSFLRSARLIDQLLDNLHPVCQRGDLVGPGQPWKLERYLGHGAFGEVWMARNPDYPVKRAYKFFTHPEAQAWVRREKDNLWQLLLRLGQQPQIVQFLDVAVNQERPYVALEYVGGGSLEDWILEDASTRAKFDKHEIVCSLAAGLAEAHRQQIFHRDLKPANVLLTEGLDVRAKIADFGLAQVGQSIENVAGRSAQSSRAMLVGTSMYLPPEAQDLAVVRAPAQDDVFAFGVLWYQLLVEKLERPPYDFSERLADHGMDTHTRYMLARCLAHPSRRYPDASVLEEELDDIAPPDWHVPTGMLDVQHLAREYLAGLSR
jgi:serine/threonine protein kinase